MPTPTITVEHFHPSLANDWDTFVWQANNGTLFHTRRFLGYHPPDRFQDHSLIFSVKDRPYALFPAAERMEQGQRWLVSHPGSSYGSFVVPEDLSFARAYGLVETLRHYGRDQGFSGIRLTMPPTIYNRRLSNYIDFALIQHGFSYARREVSSILFLEKTVIDNLKKFKPTHRRAVKKAQRMGVTVRQSQDYPAFYAILEQNLNIRHGVTPTHSLAELMDLQDRFPDRVNLFGAFIGDAMIAGVVNFIATDAVVLAFYISHDEDYQEYRALNLLFYSIFDWAIREKYQVFDFGIFTVNETPNFGLARFKENFGASGMFRDTLEFRF
ncbi:MAG: GNAT family N-acetyltransferase [Fidelibacterota bacterium]